MDIILKHEHELLTYATERLSEIDKLKICGTAKNKSSVISFVLDGVHPYDMGVLLDMQGIAVRTGHHCAEPLMRRLGIESTVRASFALYNTKDEIDVLVKEVERVVGMF
jgi:cysteine desulfurase/selenocysteine lyase